MKQSAPVTLAPPAPHQLKSFAAKESGVWPRWYRHAPTDTLGVTTLMTATSLGLHRASDVVTSACLTIEESPLRAAAWLRSRGAAVGHVAGRRRLLGPHGDQYALAACKVVSPRTNRTAFNYGEIATAKLAEFLTPRRVAIVMVGPTWPRRNGNITHALLVVSASQGEVALFDPAGHGALDVMGYHDLDALRSGACAEVLLVAAPGA